MTDQTATDLQARLREQLDTINNAIARVQDRELVKLDQLDEEIATICNSIETGESAVAHQMEGLMAEMINRLNELAESLNEFQDWARKNEK